MSAQPKATTVIARPWSLLMVPRVLIERMLTDLVPPLLVLSPCFAVPMTRCAVSAVPQTTDEKSREHKKSHALAVGERTHRCDRRQYGVPEQHDDPPESEGEGRGKDDSKREVHEQQPSAAAL